MAKKRTTRRDDVALPDEASVTTESNTDDPNETPESRTAKAADEKILALARKRFRAVNAAEEHFRHEAEADTKFRIGTWGTKTYQWDDKTLELRRRDEQPCLTINRIPGFIRQVTNAARMARLRILVSPVDDFGDPETAEVLQGIIRNIENQSFADRAYAMASEKQAEQGRGFIKLATEWAEPDNPESFRIRIKIKRVKNPLKIFVDPTDEEADYSKAQYAFEPTDLDNETFKEEFGVDPPVAGAFEGYQNEAELTGDWFPNGKTRVANYYSLEDDPSKKRKRVALLNDGTTIKYPTPEQMTQLNAMGVFVVREKDVRPKLMVVRKITATQILATTSWPAKSIPYIPVFGDELEDDGQKDWRGVVRDSKDTARLYNAEVSGLIAAVGQGLKAPVIGYRGQFGASDSAQRKAWENANKRPYAFLEVDPLEIDGKPAPFPQRNTFQPEIGGIVEAIHQTDEDLKTTAGFRDASLGERGPQESGKAIKLRQDQDQLGSSHYGDNLRFALCAVGRQLLELIPVAYDLAQVVRIIGSDERAKKVLVFSGRENDPRQNPQFQLKKGINGVFDLGAGEYDVEVSAGHTNTRRQEAADAMGHLLPALPPQVAVNFLDLYFMMLDIPMAKQMANRAKKMLPKELQDPEDGAEPIPPEAQQQIAELTQQLQMASQAIQQMQQEIATEQAKIRGQMLIKQDELAAKERIEKLKGAIEMAKAGIEANSEKALTILQGQMDRIEQERKAAFDRSLENLKHVHKIDEMLLEDQLTPDPPPATAAKPAKKKKAA